MNQNDYKKIAEIIKNNCWHKKGDIYRREIASRLADYFDKEDYKEKCLSGMNGLCDFNKEQFLKDAGVSDES